MDKSIPQQKSNHSNRNLIIAIVVVLALCLLCGLILIVLSFFGVFTIKEKVTTYNNSTNTTNTTQPTTNTTNTTGSNNNNQPQQPTTKTFMGTYVIANIPSDWNIKEYSDKNGMSAFADSGNTSFSGLTGLEILNENNTVVFSLKGIDGIGGAGGCSTLSTFADTEASYIQSIKDETASLGFDATKVTDLSGKTYTDINTLGQRFRRVDNVIYVAKNISQDKFNTACGIEQQFVKLDELSFNIKDGTTSYSANAYKFLINPAITDNSTLQKLDDVLNSLKSKNIS